MNWIVQLNFLEFWSCLFFETVTSVEEFFRNLSQMTVLRVQISPGICAFLVRSIEADKIYWCFMSCGEVAFLSEFLKESGRGMRHYITQEDLQNLQPPEAEADRSECLKFDARYVVDMSKKHQKAVCDWDVIETCWCCCVVDPLCRLHRYRSTLFKMFTLFWRNFRTPLCSNGSHT